MYFPQCLSKYLALSFNISNKYFIQVIYSILFSNKCIMLLQSKLFIAKQKIAKDWLQFQDAQRFFMQSDFNFDFASSEFRNIKYINDIFNEGKHISFIWIYNRIKCDEHKKGSHCIFICSTITNSISVYICANIHLIL